MSYRVIKSDVRDVHVTFWQNWHFSVLSLKRPPNSDTAFLKSQNISLEASDLTIESIYFSLTEVRNFFQQQ